MAQYKDAEAFYEGDTLVIRWKERSVHFRGEPTMENIKMCIQTIIDLSTDFAENQMLHAVATLLFIEKGKIDDTDTPTR